MLQGALHHLAEPKQGGKIALIKGAGLAGEKLEDAEHLVVADDGHHNNRSYAQFAADVAVHPGIACGVVATQGLSCAHAFAGESILGGEQSAQLRRVGAGAGAAHHIILFATPQSNGAATRPGYVLGALDQQLQGGIEIALGHFGQGTAGILAGKARKRLRGIRQDGVGSSQSGGNTRGREPVGTARIVGPRRRG